MFNQPQTSFLRNLFVLFNQSPRILCDYVFFLRAFNSTAVSNGRQLGVLVLTASSH